MWPREHQSSSQYRHKPVNLEFMSATGSYVQWEFPCMCKGLQLISGKNRFAQVSGHSLLGMVVLG